MEEASETSGTIPLGFRGTQIRDEGGTALLALHQQEMRVVAGPDQGLQKLLTGTRLVIGTSPKCDLMLSDPTVSRFHCALMVEGERFHLKDLESTNGTRVDNTTILEAILSPGARIQLGGTEIVFHPRTHWEPLHASAAKQFGELHGASPRMLTIFGMLSKVADTELSCILTGETGTGKELAARALHSQSRRAAAPFVVIDCAALSDSLAEAELFGNEKGAYTGADQRRLGAFELGNGGVVFLDEIGELPLHLQPKLLRVLERREVKRLGSTQVIPVDVRVVAATHRNLERLVEERRFRDDLYFRLAEVVIELPPLRERAEDIPVIARAMLAKLAEQGGRKCSLAPNAIDALREHAWAGNCRELRNALRRAHAFVGSDVIRREDLALTSAGSPKGMILEADERKVAGPPGAPPSDPELLKLTLKEARETWLESVESRYLRALVADCANDLDLAAQRAGIHRKSLERLLRQYRASDSH